MDSAWVEIPEDEWSSEVRATAAELRIYRAVFPDTVRVLKPFSIDIGISILFDIAVPQPTDGSPDLKSVEPIELRWAHKSDVTDRAPGVFSGRPDFPKDLPHLNPVKEGEYASFCLALAGHDAVFQLAGLRGLLHRLENWLTAAANNSLAFPEWHPEPVVTAGGHLACTFLDVADFQSKANDLAPGAFICGMYVAFDPRAQTATPITQSHELRETSEFLNRESPLAKIINEHNSRVKTDAKDLWYGAWILFRLSSSSSKTIFRPCSSLRDVYDVLSSLETENGIDASLKAIETGGVTGRRRAQKDKSVLLLIAIQRPTPLMSEILGTVNDMEARRFEIVGFQITAGTHNSLSHGDNRAVRSFLMPSIRSSHYNRISGVDTFPSILVIGCGALGSTILEHLLRAGAQDLTVVDKDHIEAHNLARHKATVSDILSKKADWAERFSKSLYFPNYIDIGRDPNSIANVKSYSVDITRVEQEIIQEIVTGVSFVIDASADPLVRKFISKNNCFYSMPKIRMELYDRGRLGVFSAFHTSTQADFSDLYAWLCAQATGKEPNPAIQNWLRRERQGDISLEELAIGLGCSSVTTRLPNWTVAQHASAFMPAVIQISKGLTTEARVGINTISDVGEPMGLTWLPDPCFLREPLRDGWDVVLSRSTLDLITRWRSDALPNETGGYLFGIWRSGAKRMTIVLASPAPPGSSGSPSSLTLAAANACPNVRTIRRRTARRIQLIGTWHSHPGHSSRASNTDRQTISAAMAENREIGWPTLMLIISDDQNLEYFFTP